MQTERLATLDEFGGRKFVVPAEVSGPLRRLRTYVYAALLFIFLALPWFKINGLQAILIDIPQRHFEIFGQLFLAHDVPLLFLILGFLALMLGFVTAVWGRVWCGWACPQTVFIDVIYRRIEIWIEGNYIARRKLRSAGLTWEKFGKMLLKWSAYFLVSSLFAHSFIAYFSGSDRLLQMMRGSPGDNWTYFLIVSGVTALLMFNFGWFREQFCIIMCPYGRFQSVLMDADSVTVAYDQDRGDCVSCNRCVQVCPTGIDIRNGTQMECIACTACIDACNEIMRKVHKAPDLIAFKSLSGRRFQVARPRAMACLGLTMICAVAMLFALAHRSAYTLTVLRAKDTPYQILPEGMVMNHFKLHVLNQSQNQEEFAIVIPPELAARGMKLTQNLATTVLNTGQSAEVHFFLIFPKDALAATGEQRLELWVQESHSQNVEKKEIIIVGPREIN